MKVNRNETYYLKNDYVLAKTPEATIILSASAPLMLKERVVGNDKKFVYVFTTQAPFINVVVKDENVEKVISDFVSEAELKVLKEEKRNAGTKVS